MAKVAQDQKPGQGNQPFYIRDLIAGLDLSRHKLSTSAPVVKCLLFLIYHHTNASKGYAWAKQETIAREMGCEVRTVRRAFHDTKRLNVVAVQRIRTGKHPRDCYNQYWLTIPRLRELQGEHRTVVSADTAEHRTHTSSDIGPNTGHGTQDHRTYSPRTQDASVREGFEVQVLNRISTSTPSFENPERKSKSKSLCDELLGMADANTRHTSTPINGHAQTYIQQTKAAILGLFKEIHQLETGPEAHYDQTKDDIKRLRRLAGTYRKSLKSVGHHDMTGLYERTAKSR